MSVAERLSTLRRAWAWRPIDTRALDLLAGPRGKDAFDQDDTLTCSFVYPERPLSGLSQKFRCALGEDEVKVKYGRTNAEVYAVVAASRLLWALGFGTDRWYPVRVDCRDCPEDPWRVSKVEWFKGRPRFTARRMFEVAAVEREFDVSPSRLQVSADGPGWSSITSTSAPEAPPVRSWTR